MSELDKIETVIPVGAELTITSGAYSSFSVTGVFRALRAIDAQALRSAWLAENPAQAERHHFDGEAFLAWVAKQGYVEPIPSFEWHIEDYSTADDMEVYGP